MLRICEGRSGTYRYETQIKVSHSRELSHSSWREGIQVLSAWELLSVTAANNGGLESDEERYGSDVCN